MPSPESIDANKLFFWLGGLLDWFVEELDLGQVVGSRVALRLNGQNGPEPDIAFVRKSRLHLLQRTYIKGPADLAMEIVSPESVERDYGLKRQQYEQAGVKEYWIVDEAIEKVTLLRLGSDGKYREVKPKRGVLRSAVVAGFWIRLEWLWQKPRPKKTKVLAELLA